MSARRMTLRAEWSVAGAAQIKQFEVIYTEGPMPLEEAIMPGRQIKKWSRAKKLALASGVVDRLRQLSRSRSRRSASC